MVPPQPHPREGAAEEKDLGDEGVALRLAMDHYDALGLEGGLIRVDGAVVAFTMGDPLTPGHLRRPL